MAFAGRFLRRSAALWIGVCCLWSLTSGCERECAPPCRSGFVCVKNKCLSECNPPCVKGMICRLGECVRDDRMPTPDVIVNVPLTTDSGPVTPPTPPPPEIALGVHETTCNWDEDGPFRPCTPKPVDMALERFTDKNLEKLAACRTELKARKPDAAGILTIQAELDFFVGGPPDYLTVPDDSVGDEDFKKCIVKAMRSLRASECCEYVARVRVPVYVDTAIAPVVDAGVPPAP